MTDGVVLQADGAVPKFLGGYVLFEDVPTVIVSRVADIVAGRRTVSAAAFSKQILLKSGMADVYDLNPIRAFGIGTGVGTRSGSAEITDRPGGEFSDFAAFTIKDPFIEGYVADAETGATNGPNDVWKRFYISAVPPKGTRYVVPLVNYPAMPVGNVQYLDSFQVETANDAGSNPTAFTPARSIRPHVKPTRLNLATTPFQSWTSGVAEIYVEDTIVGDVYTASIEASSDPGFQVTQVAKVTGSGSTVLEGVTRYWVTFVTNSAQPLLTFSGTYRRLLIEQSSDALPYFDGDFGLDYLWENNDVAGASRSYYYEERVNRTFLVSKTLQENAPMGLVVLDPEFAVYDDENPPQALYPSTHLFPTIYLYP